MIFGEINNIITILERLTGAWKKRKTREVRFVPHRFVELFEAHGVHRNQIPRFFDHGLTLSDLVDDASLLPKLSEPVLDAACALFAVRRGWLDGIEESPHVHHDFYKSPRDFDRFIDELKAANSDNRLDAYLIAPQTVSRDDPALLVLEETIGILDDNPIYRYHICGGWDFSYWKSRAYLTACVAIVWKKDVFVKGRFASKHELSMFNGKKILLGPTLDQLAFGERRWYAEDLALLPEQYLEGVDPERDKFGMISALRLWLTLDTDGWILAFKKKPGQHSKQSLRNTRWLRTEP